MDYQNVHQSTIIMKIKIKRFQLKWIRHLLIPEVKEPEKKTKEEIPEVVIEENDQTNTPKTPSSDDKTVPSNQENNKEDNTSEVVEEDNTEKPTYYKREKRDSELSN